MVYLLENLGFVINFSMSLLEPQKSIDFLGFLVDPWSSSFLEKRSRISERRPGRCWWQNKLQGKSFDDFAGALTRQGNRALPDLTPKALSEIIRDQFIEGLRDSYIQEPPPPGMPGYIGRSTQDSL